MNGFAKVFVILLAGCLSKFVVGQAVLESTLAKEDAALELEPTSPFCGTPGVHGERFVWKTRP